MEQKKKAIRSRFGCHRCKRLKIKCDEQKPVCTHCLKSNQICDYSIKLNWNGRAPRNPERKKILETKVNSNTRIKSSDGFKFVNTFKIDEAKEIIPHTILPLPDLLLQNNKLREHFHNYVTFFAKLLSPANPNTYTENPFATILPQISLSSDTDGILSALIATSMIHKCGFKSESLPQKEIANLTSHSLKDLNNRLISDPNSDYTLSLVLYLSFFENFRGNSNEWKPHYFNAKNIMISKGLLEKIDEKHYSFSIGEQNDLNYFFTRWFVFLDTIGSLCSSTSNCKNNTFLKWKEPVMSHNNRANLNDIDPLMGFDFKLLEYFCEIMTLAYERDDSLSTEILERALALIDNIKTDLKQKEFQRDQIEVEIICNPDIDSRTNLLNDYHILRSTNRLLHLTAILLIYKRVLKLRSNSEVIQNIVNEMTLIFKNEIPEGTPSDYSTVFSMFVVGCEVIDEEPRSFYIRRLTNLHNIGSLLALNTLNWIIKSWTNGKFWADNLSEGNSDFIII